MNEETSTGVVQASAPQRPGLKSVSDLAKGAWEKYSKHFNVLVPIMLIAGIGLYLQTIFMFILTDGYTVSATYGILALAATIIYIIGMIWGFTALLYAVNKLDEPMSLKQAFMGAKPYIAPIFIVGLITGILTLVGLILLIIPGIIVGVWLSFSYFIVFDENKRSTDALKASKAYVEGYFWPVLGRLVAVTILVGLALIILGTVANAILGYKFGTLLQNIISLGITPFIVIFQYDLYKNLKSVKGNVSAPVTTSTPTPVANV